MGCASGIPTYFRRNVVPAFPLKSTVVQSKNFKKNRWTGGLVYYTWHKSGGWTRLKAYTGTGDKGETSLYNGTRLWKNDLRVEAYGTVDELNSQIGVVRALAKTGRIDDILRTVQRELFTLGGDL